MVAVSERMEFFNGNEWKSVKDWKNGEYALQFNMDGTANMAISEVSEVREAENLIGYSARASEFYLSDDCGIVQKLQRIDKRKVFPETAKSLVVFGGAPISSVKDRSYIGGVPVAFEYSSGLLVFSEATVCIAMCVFNRVLDVDFRYGKLEVGLRNGEEYAFLADIFKKYMVNHEMYYRLVGNQDRLCVSLSMKELTGLFYQDRDKVEKYGNFREYVLSKKWLGNLSKDVTVKAAEAFYGMNSISAKHEGSFDLRSSYNCDLVQFMFLSNGIACQVGKGGKNVYVFGDRNFGVLNFTRFCKGYTVEKGYSISVPSGMVVLRCNGKISIVAVGKIDKKPNIWDLG